MPQSIQFDSTELRNTTYIPRFVKHESATERDLNLLDLARDDGSVLVNDRRGVKRITLQGILTGTSESGLETAIDTFKELLSRQEKNLDISWAGSTRRYVATCASHIFDRDFFHLLFVPWTAEFVVSSGVGKDTTITAEKHAVDVDANPYSWSSTFAGSAKPKPIITVVIGVGYTYPRGLQIKNTTNGQKITINKASALGMGDTFIFNWDTKKVTLGGVEYPFYGVFPDLIIGANSLQLQIGDIVDQEFTAMAGYGGGTSISGNTWIAQSFVVSNKDTSYRKLGIYGKKTGSPPNPLVLEIQTDNGGKPSGSKVHVDATASIDAGDIGTSDAWIYDNMASDITLEANTIYWLVAKTTAGDGSNKYEIPYQSGSLATYLKGNKATSLDAGANWTDNPTHDFGFKVYYGGTADASLGTTTLDVDYYKRYI